jgi:hypothetical protein
MLYGRTLGTVMGLVRWDLVARGLGCEGLYAEGLDEVEEDAQRVGQTHEHDAGRQGGEDEERRGHRAPACRDRPPASSAAHFVAPAGTRRRSIAIGENTARGIPSPGAGVEFALS